MPNYPEARVQLTNTQIIKVKSATKKIRQGQYQE